MASHNEEFKAADERGRRRLSQAPAITAAKYDSRMGRIIIDLSSGLSLTIKPQDVQGLEQATPVQLSEIAISPSGLGMHFPVIDADVYLPGLLDVNLSQSRRRPWRWRWEG